MGWTTLHRDPGTTDREFFETEFPAPSAHRDEILTAPAPGAGTDE